MKNFTIQKGHDARAYVKTTILAASLAAALQIADQKYDELNWSEDGFDSFDNWETTNIEDENGNIISCDASTPWGADDELTDDQKTELAAFENRSDADLPEFKQVATIKTYTVIFSDEKGDLGTIEIQGDCVADVQDKWESQAIEQEMSNRDADAGDAELYLRIILEGTPAIAKWNY